MAKAASILKNDDGTYATLKCRIAWALDAERKQIAAWLRKQAPGWSDEAAHLMIADAIERGDHDKAE